MIKLFHTAESDQMHLKYYEEVVLKSIENLKKHPFQFTELNEFTIINGTCDLTKFNLKLKKELYHLAGYIKNRYIFFALGKVKVLEIFHLDISNLFPIINKICTSPSKSATPFKKYLLKKIGYEDFKLKSLYYYIKLKAITNLNQTSVKKINQFSNVVKDEMLRLLIDFNPLLTNEINSHFGTNISYTASNFEKKFNDFKKFYLTISNFKNMNIFDLEWNDYTLLMNGKFTVCPYCNRQFISPIITPSGKVRADLDHFLSKHLYPYFSMSLYNLVPSCKQCNQSLKGSYEFSFNSLHPFKDSLNDYFNFKVRSTSKDIDLINTINLEIIEGMNGDINEYIEIFKLTPLYSYHISHVKELIYKRQIYSDDRLQELFSKKFVSNKFQDVSELTEFIIGYDSSINNLNKEPLAKLRRDIALQLGFFTTPLELTNNEIKKLKSAIL